MFQIIFLILVILPLVIPSFSFARDPWPRKQRMKHMIAPWPAWKADLKTMLRPDGKRSDMISFRCFECKPGESDCTTHYLNDINVDNWNTAYNICKANKWVDRSGNVSLEYPYLKNNKKVNPGEVKYNAYGYEWPIGDFINEINGYPGWTWATPIAYGSTYGLWYEHSKCHPNDKKADPTINEQWQDNNPATRKPAKGFRKGVCDCQSIPRVGSPDTWVHMTSADGKKEECMGPPYSTSGPWWNAFVNAMDQTRAGINLDTLISVGVRLGFDGEGRPIRSDDPWVPDMGDQAYRNQFYKVFVPAVVQELKKRYPGKTLRGMTERDFVENYLENEIDFHRESLNADGICDYVYNGLDYTVMGWWQGNADHFWITNIQGLHGWVPLYLSFLAGLSQHTDGITGYQDPIHYLYQDGKGDFLKFFSSYIGKDTRDTPGVWTHLRDTMIRKKEWFANWAAEPLCGQTEHLYESFVINNSGKYGDYEFYLYRPEELEGNRTVPVKAVDLPLGTRNQLYGLNASQTKWMGLKDKDCKSKGGKSVTQTFFVGRKVAQGNRYMSFDMDDNYAYRFAGQPGVSYDFRLVYLDVGTETFQLQYKNDQGAWVSKPIKKNDTNLWQEMDLTVNDAVFNNNASEGANAALYPTDFRLDFADLARAGDPVVPTVIHFLEVRGKGAQKIEEPRPKAQVSINLIRKPGDNPKEGIFSVGLNQTITAQATLKDNQGRPIPNERILFTYNTEWNLAQSAQTDEQGVATVTFSTANNPNSSGFLGASSWATYKASAYSFQAYFPGSRNYQPSRNDARVRISNSNGPNDPNNTRLKIKDVSPINAEGKVWVNYEVYNNTNQRVYADGRWIGKSEGFYADDPNAQTISIFGGGFDNYHVSFNQVTLYGNSDAVPSKVQDLVAQ